MNAKHARQVLADCRLVHGMLEDEIDPDRFRVLWVGALSLLRAVGHVLAKVDGTEPRLKAASDAAFKRWKDASQNHAIFTDFIEKSRNLVLKEYGFQIDLRQTVPVLVLDGSDNEHFNLDENIFRPLVDGYGSGEDCRDIYAFALEWWDNQLKEIEVAASDGALCPPVGRSVGTAEARPRPSQSKCTDRSKRHDRSM